MTFQPTQNERLAEYLRTHPGASGLEIVHALAMPKYTSRISDLRAQGIDVVCAKRADGRNGYWLAEAPPETETDLTLFFAESA